MLSKAAARSCSSGTDDEAYSKEAKPAAAAEKRYNSSKPPQPVPNVERLFFSPNPAFEKAGCQKLRPMHKQAMRKLDMESSDYILKITNRSMGIRQFLPI
jgi:hypothetical protein